MKAGPAYFQIHTLLAASAALAILSGCKTEGDSPAAQVTAIAAAPSAWTEVIPEGDTICATGTDYKFHVREGDPSRVMIFMNGGGACWSGDLCDLGTEPTPYVPFAEMDANNPALMKGAFDPANPENPFLGWTQVFVPYCTGDAHLGARDVTYTTSTGKEVTIHHQGKANVQSVLDWVYENHPAPERIFVGGGSAGAIASPFYAGLIADHYPQAEIVQMAGGAGGYRSPGIAAVFETWGVFEEAPDWPELAAIDRSTATMEDLFHAVAKRHPAIRLTQFNNVSDGVQQQFLTLLGTDEPVAELMKANLADITADVPGFRSYSAPGEDHTLLRFDRLYTTEVAGVRAVDWIRALAEGADVTTVSCESDDTCE